MTKKEVNEIYYLIREVEMWKRKLEELREGGMQSPKLDGLPRSRKISDSTGDKATSEADIEMIIEGILKRVQQKEKEIYEYIDTLNDSLVRQIIMHRCVSLCSWQEVAACVGGNNTADSVRMTFNRHFDNGNPVRSVR